MLYRTIFVCLIGFVLAKSAEQDPLEITFIISPIKMSTNGKNFTKLSCDHSDNDKLQHIYTVREGDQFKIITKYNKFINHLICSDYNSKKDLYKFKSNDWSNITTFKVKKTMGTIWNCTVLAHHNSPTMLPAVQYRGANYSAAYCFMKIHVRQTKSPQTILVNNMVLEAVRTNLSEKDVDFTAEYRYADGDVVNVTCANFLNEAPLTMEYAMAGSTSGEHAIAGSMTDLQSKKAIGLVAPLHSGHDNSFMICNNTESNDYTKVMVRLVMRTEFNIINIKINGMTLRPEVKKPDNSLYEIEYKYLRHQVITVTCEVQRTDVKLVMDKVDFDGKVNNYKKRDLIGEKKIKMSFCPEPKDSKKLLCSADYLNGKVAEQVAIHFTEGHLPIDEYGLNMELPPNGTVMQLYNDENKLKVIVYEFEDNETLQLTCGPLIIPQPGPVLYLQFKDPENKCKTNGCTVSKKVNLTHEPEISCYKKEQKYERVFSSDDSVLSEIRVILRKRVLTTTTSTTTTTTTTTTTMPVGYPIDADIQSDASPETEEKDGKLPLPMLAVISGAVLCIIMICAATVTVKLRKRNHSQGGPHNRNYQNLQSPSETSIPVYPPQWEPTYAAPVDRKAEDTTYSVPFQEPALYSTPTPKNLRNKKQKPVDPTYAVLQVPNARGRKNTFKETDDPNYSEVYANRQDQCYGKVLPKSVRDKMAPDHNPYSYATNEPAYVNTAEPEPMYCEPAKAQGGTYANLNNSHYANSNAQEYVEPTYCEPQKRMK